MDKKEAENILHSYLVHYRDRTYKELVACVDKLETSQVTGDSGTDYQIEIQIFWDDPLERDIRVMGCVDDGGLRAFVPLCKSFIMAPDGTFIDE